MAYLHARTVEGPVFNGVTCKLWTKATDYDGYGKFTLDGHCLRAHRVAFFLAKGYWPKPTTDHLCRRRACIEPAHLEAVTVRVNILRGEGPSAKQARQVTCKNGHPITGDDVYRWKGQRRRCRLCHRATWKRFYQRNRERRLSDVRARLAQRRHRHDAANAS
jgi:hypothetical protein